MLKYKVLSEYQGHFTWTVNISGKIRPTVGDFIREIKYAPIHSSTGITPIKIIYIYRKGIQIGTCSFKGEENIKWDGSPKEIWTAIVDKCEMHYANNDMIFKIWTKEPREGAYAWLHPVIPWLKNKVSIPIPVNEGCYINDIMVR